MAARFPQGKQPKFPVHCIGTRKLSDLIYRMESFVPSSQRLPTETKCHSLTVFRVAQQCYPDVIAKQGSRDNGWKTMVSGQWLENGLGHRDKGWNAMV